MRIITAYDLEAAFTWRDLVEAMRSAFRGGLAAPARHHHALPPVAGLAPTLLLMPAWGDGTGNVGQFGVKIVSVFPSNAARAKPSVGGLYLLFSQATGEALAIVDGTALTLWRTAATSALAADYLARTDASRLVMVGAGALAPKLIAAHACVRPIRHVAVWARRPEQAGALARKLAGGRFRIAATDDLEGAVRDADIVSTATLSSEPLVRGDWLKDGAHLDLVGAFRPTMRETDDTAITRARLFCDHRETALREGGDLALPLASGLITADDIAADLFEMARGGRAGRRGPDQVTLFKSVGNAIEDLAAARLALRRLGG